MIVDGLGGDEQDAELEGRGAKGFVEDALNSNRAEGETIVALVGFSIWSAASYFGSR
jgi:hypothetical protein